MKLKIKLEKNLAGRPINLFLLKTKNRKNHGIIIPGARPAPAGKTNSRKSKS